MSTLTCARCGRENPADAKFCLECGNALIAPVASREERKVVTVLFADLVGFTSQAEQLDPEEVRAVLAPYHARVRAELQHYGGTVEKFIGDAVMALFGAPIAHEDDPERAVRAALAIRDALTGEGALHVRIGVTTGEALIALEARPESGEGMASGDVVNTASRLQSAAPVDGILVDQATFRATSRAIDYAEHEPVTVKGKAEPIVVHAAVAARSRFGVDVRQSGAVPLVGRSREMDMLSDALARAHSERQPQLVTLIGVPGIGKSRLVWELFQHADAGDQLVAWRQGRSLPYAESISFWAMSEMVKAEAGILETDQPADAGEKLGRAVASVIEQQADVEWIERHLRPLVGLEASTEVRGDRRGEAFAAWRRYFEALADHRPLVLVFEDIHWADEGLLDFIDYLVDWASDVPLLIVGTARPELITRRPGWGGGKPNAFTASLSPLSETETASLVGALIEQAVMPVSVRQAVLERAQGNPLYAEEFARLLASGGHTDELPETVQGIIAARLDSLDRAHKELLQDAAVMGKVFWSGAIADMRAGTRFEVEEQLHTLERREFVRRERRSSVATETEYAFRHILMRDVAYGQIPRARRAERHVAAAAWIESLGRPADHAELLAQHYLAAMELDRAADRPTDRYAVRARAALADAGAHALALNAFGAAARYLRAALELTPQDDTARPRLLFDYGKALRVSEEAGDDVLAEAEQALRAAGESATAAEAAVLQAELMWFRGDSEATHAHLRRAADLVDDLPPSFSKAYVLSDLSRYHMLDGENAEAIVRGQQALAIAHDLGLEEIVAHALNNIGMARVGLADGGGIDDLERALEIARRINSPEQARVLNNFGAVLAGIGETERSWALSREALAVARELGHRSVERFARNGIPFIDYAEGKWDAALEQLDEFLAEAAAAGGDVSEAGMRVLRSRIRRARGDLEEAESDALLAVAVGRRAAGPQLFVEALAYRAWRLLEMGRPSEAVPLLEEVEQAANSGDFMPIEGAIAMASLGRHANLANLAGQMIPGLWHDVFAAFAEDRLTDAVGLLDHHGYKPHAALVRLAIARQLTAAGDPDGARGVLEPAVTFWRSVGATYWLADADRLVADPALGERARADVRAE